SLAQRRLVRSSNTGTESLPVTGEIWRELARAGESLSPGDFKNVAHRLHAEHVALLAV
ncbi:hypothetical protein A2U01_0073987, partial [Trifolium medium]|nr:hypothetical protein [Trifolium medium]